jgi:NADPH:quinone reductase-like Zn-dependent oxidoreductase
MQAKMKAVLIREYGANDVVELQELDVPQPREGEVLLKVRAAGVNPIDFKIRGGAGERLGLTLPIALGGELVGTVERLGPGVDKFGLGDELYGMVKSGAFAEYAVAKAADLVRTPGNLDAVHAAALPLAGSTAWHAIFDEAGLSEGQRLLITGSSGGVGSLAIQFAKARGAQVIAIASARNEAFVRELGADEFIDYQAQLFEDVARDIDVVFDTVGGDTFGRAFKTLRKGGFMVTVVAFPQGEADEYGVRVKRSFTAPSGANLSAITQLVEAGKVVPHVDTVFPLSDIRGALALSEGGHARGKIVLAVGG